MGYQAVGIRHNGIRKHCYVHRLMAFSYFDIEDEEFDVNHIDKNRCNNHITNLEALDRKSHLRKDLGKPIICKKIGEEDQIFSSIAEAAEFLNVNSSSVTKSIRKNVVCQTWKCSFA